VELIIKKGKRKGGKEKEKKGEKKEKKRKGKQRIEKRRGRFNRCRIAIDFSYTLILT
jgi:hypothetical protein